ncbi:MAG: heme A synthase [Acidobacteria bacterium]|nr:heme A synthase [Acidobacteriota bacterium]
MSRYARFAWFVLAFNLLVIVWGAFVRASGSGAGCGSHWPLCNGAVIPRAPSMKTLIEISHRATSGIALLLVVAMVVWAFRAYAARHPVRRIAVVALVLMFTEALIGAGLVLFEYVAENKSIARGLWMSGHLVNTFLLVGALTLTAWLATESRNQISLRIGWCFALALFGMLLLGVSGAVTALGGTLFPVTSLAEGLRQDLSPTSHILIRLRFYHPLIALAVSGWLVFVAMLARKQSSIALIKRLANALVALVTVQLLAGLMNLLLHAPIWLQLVHLLLSDLVWIVLLLLAYNASQEREARAVETPINYVARPV